jgi:hypothetical protein
VLYAGDERAIQEGDGADVDLVAGAGDDEIGPSSRAPRVASSTVRTSRPSTLRASRIRLCS